MYFLLFYAIRNSCFVSICTPPRFHDFLLYIPLCYNSCQEVLLESMQLGRNIARNSALRENVFMMAICIDLRIPLFLVGKPGSSKSLAKSIVANSMNGKSSKNELLKSFKEVCLIYVFQFIGYIDFSRVPKYLITC